MTTMLTAVAASTLVVACVGTPRSPDSVAAPGASGPVAVAVESTGATATTSTLPTGAVPATTTTTSMSSTSTSSTTTTTTAAAWQAFPTSPVKPYPIPHGSSPLLSRIDTTDPVVFITIDDGLVRDPRVAQLLADHGATATLFLNSGPIRLDPGYFVPFLWIGGSINSHTSHHPHLRGLDFDAQRKEICAVVQQIDKVYGGNGGYFRPPYGEWDRTTLAAAASCGVRAVLLWKETMADGEIRTQGSKPIQPGDIVLLHFRTDLYDNLTALFAQLDLQGLSVARLEDYLPAA
ncbi:unannotated protein [freshwater metagenome]|uniref:Unannotated protein n=1 Tax=freshwater metagenome TaxID=449393 RepID=A0A6J6T3N1_9ZZZZ